MRKLILSFVFSIALVVLSVAPTFADSVGPTP
jgi:hypothetical protein